MNNISIFFFILVELIYLVLCGDDEVIYALEALISSVKNPWRNVRYCMRICCMIMFILDCYDQNVNEIKMCFE